MSIDTDPQQQEAYPQRVVVQSDKHIFLVVEDWVVMRQALVVVDVIEGLQHGYAGP